MRFLLVPLGTYGDFLPFRDLALTLQQRGHQVTLACSEVFGGHCREHGLPFEPLLSEADWKRVFHHPDIWHRRRFFPLLVEGLMGPAISPLVKLAHSQVDGGKGLRIVTGLSGGPGANLAARLTGATHISVWLNPASIRSLEAPPLLSGLELMPFLPKWLRRAVHGLLDAETDRLLAPVVNGALAELGRPPVEVAGLHRWLVSETLSLALFPQFFAPIQRDWPPNSRQTGFPLTSAKEHLPSDVKDFLAAGAPPVAITFGTAMFRTERLVAVAVEACRRQGLRPLILGPGNGPRIPLNALLPRVKAIIHHGGVGTAAQALATATPQLVVPLAHDQPDNAWRLYRMGVAGVIPRPLFRPWLCARTLSRLCHQETLRTRCRYYARKMAEFKALDHACRALCEPISDL